MFAHPYLLLAFAYVLMALLVTWFTALDNEKAPGWVNKPNPWLRGALWLPIILVGAVWVLFNMASGAFKPRR